MVPEQIAGAIITLHDHYSRPSARYIYLKLQRNQFITEHVSKYLIDKHFMSPTEAAAFSEGLYYFYHQNNPTVDELTTFITLALKEVLYSTKLSLDNELFNDVLRII